MFRFNAQILLHHRGMCISIGLVFSHCFILSEVIAPNIMDNHLIKLAEQLGDVLKAQGRSIATAESCTGGLIATLITEIPGSSAWFDRGFVTYSNQAKIDMLGVKPETLAQFGAVSSQTAVEMVEGALANSQADWAIAVTGIAGPDGGSHDKPVGTVYVAWLKKTDVVHVERLQLIGSRHGIRARTAQIAIERIVTQDSFRKITL
jgi:nicotinamide-nucleotide amidase